MKKNLEERFQELGYVHRFPLAKTITVGLAPLCHYIDILVDEQQGTEPWIKFLNSFMSSTLGDTVAPTDSNHIIHQHRFVKDLEKRDHLIRDFKATEMNYIANLHNFLKAIVLPLRSRTKDKRKCILGAYECNQIFINIDDVYKVNTAFAQDVKSCSSDAIGLLFSRHLDQFKAYHHFLLGLENAKSFHTKEMRSNLDYHQYLEKRKDGNPTVYDYLLLPAQRLGHYKLFLQGLLKHTPKTHQDFTHLVNALAKIEAIASMPDDYHTNLIHIFQNILQSIQDCPASLISQQRCLIDALDVVEYDLCTLKPISPVTLFLFSDKVMVVRRPTFDSEGLDLCGLYRDVHTGSITTLLRKGDPSQQRRLGESKKLKFRGWLPLGYADLYQGVPEIPGSLMLVATRLANSPSNNIDIDQLLENYFHEDRAHLFAIPNLESHLAPSSSHSSLSSNHSILHKRSISSLGSTHQSSPKMNAFVKHFGRTRMKDVYRGSSFKYMDWQDHHLFARIHDLSMYHTVHNKSDTAIALINDKLGETPMILQHTYSLPSTLLVVAPSEIFGFNLAALSQHVVQSVSSSSGDEDLADLSVIDDLELTDLLLTNGE
ncbi:Dbl homology domain-containing protein [Hesseltinella vesiculosa]|uniref:Dbl homology domain-containing protein n=1 Tax=Hesseltinella vesiculosa TaxID=101127 RepID=A0A1X2G8R4_9FUNG|nr:Dbl homology domain-containing protein [Hesseltinella vesiculosa]